MSTPASLSTFERYADLFLHGLRSNLLAWFLAVTMLVALLPRPPSADPDLFARLAVGRLVAETGAVTDQDPFAYTPRLARWIDHEWLSGVLFYQTWRAGGDQALVGLQVFFLAATLAFLLAAARSYQPSEPWSSFAFLSACLPCSYLWTMTIRSQVVTYLFFAYLLFAIGCYFHTARRRWLYLLPVLMPLWSNCHGGFVAGLGILLVVSLYALARKDVKPAIVCILATLATGITPYGSLAYWSYILNAVMMSRPSIDEWHPITVLSADAVIPVLLLGCVACGMVAKLGRHNFRAHDALSITLLIVTAIFGFRHYRLVGMLLMTIGVVGGSLLAGLSTEAHTLARRGLRAWAVVLFLGVVISLPYACSFFVSAARSPTLDTRAYPGEAIRYLATKQQGGNLLISFNAGSYALWSLPRSFKVAVDGRYEELYPESTVLTVARALDPRHPEHEGALRAIEPDFIITENETAPLFGPRFHTLHRDQAFTVLGKW